MLCFKKWYIHVGVMVRNNPGEITLLCNFLKLADIEYVSRDLTQAYM